MTELEKFRIIRVSTMKSLKPDTAVLQIYLRNNVISLHISKFENSAELKFCQYFLFSSIEWNNSIFQIFRKLFFFVYRIDRNNDRKFSKYSLNSPIWKLNKIKILSIFSTKMNWAKQSNFLHFSKIIFFLYRISRKLWILWESMNTSILQKDYPYMKTYWIHC